MAKQFFKDLPDTSTPITASRLNGLLDGEEAMGNLVVDSIRSKNIFDSSAFIKDVGTSYSVLPTGVRINLNVSARYMWGVFKLPDDLLGKTITISSTITPSASNNGKIGLAFGDSSNDHVGNFIVELKQTGNITATIPSSFPSGANKIILLIYGNVDGTGVVNDYVDYTNLQIEEGTTATTYSPYQNLNGEENYSKTEQVIGTWIDGKPIYRKVINAGTVTTTNTAIGNIPNIDKLVSIKGSAYSSQFNQKYGIPNVHNDMTMYYINLLIVGDGVVIRFGTGVNQLDNVFAIVEYTKTTD